MQEETLNELKERMMQLERMFTRILVKVDKIGSDIQHMKQEQASAAS